MLGRLVPLFLVSLLTTPIPSLAEDAPEPAEPPLRDGRLFDPSIDWTAPAESAPAELERLAGLVGDWTVVMELHQPGPEGVTVTKSEGRARVTFMNRGHALMERTRVDNFDAMGEGAGHRMSTLAFWNVDAHGVWTVAEGNGWTESIRLYGGSLADDGKKLVVHDGLRPGGGPTLMLLRRAYEVHGGDRFTMTQETSQDLGTTWSTAMVRDYRRHRPEDQASPFDPAFFPVRDDVGLPAPDRADEAAQFDFLLGEFDASHWQRSPQGQERRWTSDATAVYVLDGRAVLEFDSFSTDPTLPDAATSILRIYNRAMRRWENLFLPNRSHRPLYFGGVQEGDRIVLHLFGASTGPGSVFQWIFYDVEKDSYRWKGLSSSDRGETYRPNWTIEFDRKGAAID